MESAASRCTAFSWLLALALLLHQLWWGISTVLSAHGVVAGCALAVLARPSSVRRLVVLLAAEAVAVLAGLPNLGDHTLLVFVTAGSTLAYVLARVARTRRLPEPGVLFAAMVPLLRGQLLVLYGAAALAKLNTGFPGVPRLPALPPGAVAYATAGQDPERCIATATTPRPPRSPWPGSWPRATMSSPSPAPRAPSAWRRTPRRRA